LELVKLVGRAVEDALAAKPTALSMRSVRLAYGAQNP